MLEKIKNFFQTYWITILIFLGLIFGYIFITENNIIDPYLFPTVDQIIASYQEFWKNLILGLFSSFSLLIPSIFLGTLVAIVVGVFLGTNSRAREVLMPVVETLSVIPSILLSPFLVLVMPSFRHASIAMLMYAVIWPTLFATVTGIMTIDRRYLDTAETLEIHGIKRLFKVILPAAMPSVLSGFSTSLRSSFTTLTFAEMYGAEYGMGYFVKRYADLGLFNHVWSGFIFLVIVLVLVMRIYETIESRLLKWTIA